ncbi:MAG TPA: ABC transporter substrate-binding protein [Jatrophihabitans sp.]|jgi:sn-glycerol 3-phosphate transport system substrate-binding protein|uniref:ABC transporter substrate-binding protein n=1 Tax=Jatrophihabitans sp. TaxID=1932789 RepID=UPI002F1A25CF
MRYRLSRTLWSGTAALALALTVACGSSSNGSDAKGSDAAPGADVLNSGPVTVSFWHAMKGANADALNALVEKFNSAHSGKITVKPTFQGSYDDTITKYKAAVQAKQTPALVQIYDIGSGFMADSGQTIPAQAFADLDKYDLSDIQPAIKGYYSRAGKLQSMPFNSSVPVLYINKTAFTKAGLDPTKPPANLDEIRTAAEKIKASGAAKFGFGAAIYGWFFEQLTAQAGKTYCNNDNGRTKRADAVTFDDPEQVKVLSWWKGMVDDGLATNTGRKTDDAQAAFKSGTVAMHLESTGALGGYVTAAAGTFEVATAPFPKIQASDTGGPIIGGASLWIGREGHSAAEQRASWEFGKFLLEPANAAYWHTKTGYFPITKAALEEDIDKQWVAEKPQFKTAIDQLAASPVGVPTQGCLLGTLPQIRALVENALESVLTSNKDPKAALDEAASQAKSLIDKYNSSVK